MVRQIMVSRFDTGLQEKAWEDKTETTSAQGGTIYNMWALQFILPI
jgi:hypothetical protein